MQGMQSLVSVPCVCRQLVWVLSGLGEPRGVVLHISDLQSHATLLPCECSLMHPLHLWFNQGVKNVSCGR